MGFCHRVAKRLLNKKERIRRLEKLSPFHQSLFSAQSAASQKKKTANIENPVDSIYTGLSFVLTVLPVWYRLSYPNHLYFFGSLVVLLSSFLVLVWLMETIGRMDVSLFNYRPSSTASDWRSISSKIVSGTRRNFLKMEKAYLDMKNISVLFNQLVFFCLCERVFMLRQPVVSFYTLMFFNVIAYCVSYIKELIEREDWSMYVHITRGSNVRHLAMTTTKIVLEWTKAVTFIITVVFILLVFGLEKGLKNYSPGVPYLVITGIYYIISEKVFVNLICQVLDKLKFECFESMENLYSPLILKGIQIGLSFMFTIICGLLGHVRITMIACFTNLRFKYKEVDSNHWQPLLNELVKLMKYRIAERDEILSHDDVCAICLQPMKTARVTPCRHFFHADCLRRCLIQSPRQSCPICKQDLPPMVIRDK